MQRRVVIGCSVMAPVKGQENNSPTLCLSPTSQPLSPAVNRHHTPLVIFCSFHIRNYGHPELSDTFRQCPRRLVVEVKEKSILMIVVPYCVHLGRKRVPYNGAINSVIVALSVASSMERRTRLMVEDGLIRCHPNDKEYPEQKT